MKEQKGIPIDRIIKRAMVQLKYEEIGSWLVTHNVPLFYAHDKGFSVIDKKYLEDNPKLKKMLDETIKDIEKKHKKKKTKSKKKSKFISNYFG